MSITSWSQFAWACYLYGSIGGDKDYQKVNSNNRLLTQLRNDPQYLLVSDMQDHVIKGFLNKWNCRLTNTPQAAEKIRDKLTQVHPYLKALQQYNIRDSFKKMVSIDSQTQITLGDLIAKCYLDLFRCTKSFASTATSKLLHIIAPDIIVMWDNPILFHYRKIDKRLDDSGKGFALFHEIMQNEVTVVGQLFNSTPINPPANQGQKFENYLSASLKRHLRPIDRIDMLLLPKSRYR